MKKETLFRIIVAVGVLWGLYAERWIGAIVFISVYVIGRLIVKMAYRKFEDPNNILYYLSMVCMVVSVLLGIIANNGNFTAIITVAWLLSTLWQLKTE